MARSSLGERKGFLEMGWIGKDGPIVPFSRDTGGAPAGPESLRVLLVTARFSPQSGGVEIHTNEVARRLAAAGHGVTVLTTDPSGRLAPLEDRWGVRIVRVKAWPSERDYYFAPGIWRVITRGRWDVVHVQGVHTLVAPLAMLASCRANIPYVVTFHGGGHSSRLRTALRGLQRALLRPLLTRAERLVALAEFEVELFGERLRIPTERFVLIANGADLPEVPAQAPAPADGTLIASIGRLERYKGHHRVIAALPKVLEQRPDVRLWIAGAGPYEPDLRRLARKWRVADRVDIHAVPATDRRAMASQLSRVDLAVLLSEYETQPIAILEALALGRPALVADTSGLSELARRGLARAIPLESTPEQVAAAVLDQLDRPLLPTAVELPTWDECVFELLALYRAVARRPACAS